MEINRNQYFAIGVVILFLGIQFRYFESFTLNAEATEFIREKLSKAKTPSLVKSDSYYNGYSDDSYESSYFSSDSISPSTLTVTPPKWIGWALLSLGGVLVLHSFSMRKPG